MDGAVNVIGEGGPRPESFEIGPRIRPWSRFVRTVKTGRPEFSLSIVCKREIWEVGLHCISLVQRGWQEQAVVPKVTDSWTVFK